MIAARFIENKGVDDCVGAIAVHGVNGLFGVLAVGLFADGTYGDGTNGVVGGVRGLFYGDGMQIIAQSLGAVANFAWVGLSAFVAWKITGVLVGGHRVAARVEDEGLDMAEMGVLAYPADLASPAVLPEAPRRKAVEAA